RVRLMRARRSPSMKDDSGTVWTLSDMVSLRRGRARRLGAHDRKVGRNCCPRGRYNPRRDSLLAAYVAATGMSGLKQTRSFLGDFLEISWNQVRLRPVVSGVAANLILQVTFSVWSR